MYFLNLFLDRGEGREQEKERNISVWLPLVHPQLGTWAATQAYALTGNWTVNPLLHSIHWAIPARTAFVCSRMCSLWAQNINIYIPKLFKENNFFLKIFYLFIFRGGMREKDSERHISIQEEYWSIASHMPPTGGLAHNPGMCPAWELNQQLLSLQDGAQSTEAH